MILFLFSCVSGPLSVGDTGYGVHSDVPERSLQRDFVPATEADDLDPSDEGVRIELRAAVQVHTIEDWRTGEVYEVDGYAYNGVLPGPVIRAKVGDILEVELTNALSVPTTIHWHGLEVPWDMDGVTWMAEPVMPDEVFTYRFELTRSGTFWYHPHYDTANQVDRGLYGALIVEEPDQPNADQDLVVFVDDWSVTTLTEATTWHVDGAEIHGAHGGEGIWTVNGVVQPTLRLDGGSAARVRIINASNVGYLDIEAGPGRFIAGDQGLLESPVTERQVLGPGDRQELEWWPALDDFQLVDHPYSHHGGAALGDIQSLLDVEVSAPSSMAEPLDFDFSMTEPSVDPGGFDVAYTFHGDPHSDVWLMNGESYPDITVQSIPRESPSIIEVRNVSATAHPFHLHGMFFEILSINGIVPEHRVIEDTIHVGLYETVRLRVEPPNEGDWMAHCHILPHGHGGMMQVLRVETE
jgi:FtsP/CotA-like multicopper oxidase with cupredoxin domain